MKIPQAPIRLLFYFASTGICSLLIFINIVFSFEIRYPEMMNESFLENFLLISVAAGILINYIAYLAAKKIREAKSAY